MANQPSLFDSLKKKENEDEQEKLAEVLFPVELRKIFYEKRSDNGPEKYSIKDYMAVINTDTEDVLSVVSKYYRLVTNEEAIEYGKEAFKQLFNTIYIGELKIFNIITPNTKSFCHIDLIHKDYKVNIGEKEVYLPFIRVTNSYNRVKALRFDLGFAREICSNGMIIEEESIRFKFFHTKQAIQNEIDFDIKRDRLTELEKRFINYMHRLNQYEISSEYALPVMCKALDIKFDIENSDLRKSDKAKMRLDEFKQVTVPIVDKYYSELGSNAYAVFNAITEFSSSPRSGITNSVMLDNLQKKAGRWAETFSEHYKEESFDLTEYTSEYTQYFN